MKYLISFIIGLVAFILCFNGGGDIINWMLSGITGPVHFVLWIILWFLFFGIIVQISYIVGVIVSTFVVSILDRFD